MLEASIIGLLLFLVFAFIIGYLFLMPAIVVASNVLILYLLFLRIYTEITKYKRAETYAYSFAAAALLLLIVKNFLPVWWITTCALLAFIIAQVYTIYKKS